MSVDHFPASVRDVGLANYIHSVADKIEQLRFSVTDAEIISADMKDLAAAIAGRSTHHLHERARLALTELGLDTTRFDLCVGLFGWGSDEANGALLGLVRKAWNDPDAFVMKDGQCWLFRARGEGGWPIHANGKRVRIEEWTEVDALVAALLAATKGQS